MANILLVEDDTFISDIIETSLTKAGHVVVTMSDGNEVLPYLCSNKVDVVLLDLMLPNRHGFDILQEIRETESLTQPPVVVLSNENGLDVEEKAHSLQASYYFKALTDMDKLQSIITDCLTAT